MTQHRPTAGDVAPDFTADTTAGKPVTLSAFRGQKNVLIAFFPLAFTSTCTAELCSFTDDYAAFAAKDVEVIPISVDAVASLEGIQGAASHDDGARQRLPARYLARVRRAQRREVLFGPRLLPDRQEGRVVRWAFVEAVNGDRRQNAEILAEIAKLAS